MSKKQISNDKIELNRIEEYLKTLSLHKISEIYKTESEKAAKTKLGYQDYFLKLL